MLITCRSKEENDSLVKKKSISSEISFIFDLQSSIKADLIKSVSEKFNRKFECCLLALIKFKFKFYSFNLELN